MGNCFVHGNRHEVPGAQDKIFFCELCVEEMKRSVLVVCESCGIAFFLDPEFAREALLGDNPEKPEASSWLEKLPILLVLGGCSECQAESEAAIGVKIFSGFEIKEGRALL